MERTVYAVSCETCWTLSVHASKPKAERDAAAHEYSLGHNNGHNTIVIERKF